MTKEELIDYISEQLAVPVTKAQRIVDSFVAMADFIEDQIAENVPEVPSASANTPGIAKLFNTVNGSGTDGSVTQAAINSALQSLHSKIYVGSFGSF